MPTRRFMLLACLSVTAWPGGAAGAQPAGDALALRGQRLTPVKSREPHLVPKPLLGREGQRCLGPLLGSSPLPPEPMEHSSTV